MLSILKIDLQFSFSIFLRTNNFQFNFSKSSFGYEPSHAAPIGVICGTCSFSYFHVMRFSVEAKSLSRE